MNIWSIPEGSLSDAISWLEIYYDFSRENIWIPKVTLKLEVLTKRGALNGFQGISVEEPYGEIRNFVAKYGFDEPARQDAEVNIKDSIFGKRFEIKLPEPGKRLWKLHLNVEFEDDFSKPFSSNEYSFPRILRKNPNNEFSFFPRHILDPTFKGGTFQISILPPKNSIVKEGNLKPIFDSHFGLPPNGWFGLRQSLDQERGNYMGCECLLHV
jgi:hypothetical protein